MKKKKIAIIGTAGIPANYGGFETLAEHLAEEMSATSEVSVYCSSKKYPKEKRQSYYKNARLIYIFLSANGMQSIIYDALSIMHAIFYADVLLILGVPGAFLIPFVRLFTTRKIITSIDGIEWKRNKWSKKARWFLWASEWVAVKYSHANIADNESIQDYTAMRYDRLSNIIEYGADHIQHVKPQRADYLNYSFLSKSYSIKVCRIEPENNIEMVLEAFAHLEKYTLVMVGNWNNSNYGQSIREKYRNFKNIFLLDPIYDARSIDLLRSNATVYIHGHSAGGTNPSLVEAMHLGLPVIAFDVMYNKTTTEQQAIYFKNARELEAVIQKTSIADLLNVGNLMRDVAVRRYTWRVIASKYNYLIEAVMQKKWNQSLKGKVSNHLPNGALLQHEINHLQAPAFFYEKRS